MTLHFPYLIPASLHPLTPTYTGTETITLGEMQPTVYTLYVNNYQSLAATELAQVRVDIMGNTGTLMTVREPQGLTRVYPDACS